MVLDAHPRKHGPARDVTARLARLERGEPEPEPAREAEPEPAREAEPEPVSDAALAVEARLRDAWLEPPIDAELGAGPGELAALRRAGRAVRVGLSLHYHPDALAEAERRVRGLIEHNGSVTIAQLRDELGTSRKFAQALLEHFDGAKVTRRVGDTHLLRRR